MTLISASEMFLFFPFGEQLKKSKTTIRNRVDNWNIITLIISTRWKVGRGGGGGRDAGDYIWG